LNKTLIACNLDTALSRGAGADAFGLLMLLIGDEEVVKDRATSGDTLFLADGGVVVLE